MGFLFGQPAIQTKPKPKPPVVVDNRERWKALAPHIKKHFKTDMPVNDIAAELAYQEYLIETGRTNTK